MATKHNHGPNFGKREDGCDRCTELKNGAEPVSQPWRQSAAQKRKDEADRARGIRNHNCGRTVCTCFDW